MDSKIIFGYILNLENENIDLKNKNEQLIITLNDLNDEYNSLKKVSLMLKFNKQLKEKDNTITQLENQIRNIKSKKVEPIAEIKVEPIAEIKVEPIAEIKVEPMVETKVEPMVETKVESMVETKVEPMVEIKNDTDIENNLDVKIELTEENGKKKKKKPKNCEIIKYKTTEYLLNNDTNEIFELHDKKLSESLGILKNGKVKFYKK